MKFGRESNFSLPNFINFPLSLSSVLSWEQNGKKKFHFRMVSFSSSNPADIAHPRFGWRVAMLIGIRRSDDIGDKKEGTLVFAPAVDNLPKNTMTLPSKQLAVTTNRRRITTVEHWSPLCAVWRRSTDFPIYRPLQYHSSLFCALPCAVPSKK